MTTEDQARQDAKAWHEERARPSALFTTVTGRIVDLACFDSAQVEIREIAHALSRQCRYAGHVEGFYSVAEHSVIVARMALEEHRKTVFQVYDNPLRYSDAERALVALALLHDAHEAYLGDMIGPLKGYLDERGAGVHLRALEASIDDAIRLRFGLGEPGPEVRALIKAADKRALLAEQTRLRFIDETMHTHHVKRGEVYDNHEDVEDDPEGTRPVGLMPDEAKALFLVEWQRLFM